MKQWLGKWLPVIVWFGVIFIGSSISSVPKFGAPALDGWLHRLAHVAEYAVLGWLLMRALSNGQLPTRRVALLTLIAVIAYGISDEFHQRFTPGRSSELIAVVWDLLGGAIGTGLWWLNRRRLTQRIKASTSRQVVE